MRTAILVDAGYLYAAGTTAISGEKRSRRDVGLNVPMVVEMLINAGRQKTEKWSLLRIYWYDGARSQVLSPEHRHIADTDNVKLRLGVVTPFGKQKGVDSLLVTDLIELARNRAISDVVILSGDEDIRIGVQIAQSFGVRVHLIGIAADRNQSQLLRHESDTTTAWAKADVESFLSLMTTSERSTSDLVDSQDWSEGQVEQQDQSNVEKCVSGLVDSLTSDDLRTVANLDRDTPIPAQFDRLLLTKCSKQLGRRLNDSERHEVRYMFKKQSQYRLQPIS